MPESCPCGSGLEYNACCGPYIAGSQIAPTPGALMRSRFSAYVRHSLDYLIATWHPDCHASAARSAIGDSFKDTEWLGLTIVEEKTGHHADEGFVEFIARFVDGSGEPQAMHERSRFLRLEQRWYYIDGTKPQPGRNAICPCGSGKKYKKCCGR
ncbi:YchJ family protein [Serratia ficaria]|uniref:YchJ family protein n=1 Tax=Serratia ficaria TaxID=61651 RepID=UPI002177C4BD|nr:YchJ family protein [Serratia ficaria]CAI0728107.1 Predicted metal-binding protein related to the C-terminal domain of SecA [Serratia ficaria]CAI0772677.1 Predicted metal-binding protein related to the C-terminal domain of SecA [Serratia ficaria]CAI1633280.1 Predicted metal-binding protein related to the C-terminal domain of SecA [Serratia ficaria]CAI1644985.1 Predicted metal-binding protein related to the C-terminal domain of SecA [Serratia ficaria]CAI2403015.1 Predicted metal-binding prot